MFGSEMQSAMFVNEGRLKFQEANLNHEDPSINVVDGVMTRQLAAKEEKGQTSMKFLLKKLLEVGIIRCDGTVEDECALHPNGSHSIEKCKKFKELLRTMVDNNMVQIMCNSCEDFERMSPSGSESVDPAKPLVLHLPGSAFNLE